MKEAISKEPRGRPIREPVGHRGRLTVRNPDPNYVYRWAVDSDGTGDRMEELKSMGYEHVPKGLHKIGDARVQNASAEGSIEAISAGGGQKAYLMRQPKEWNEEDKKAHAAKIDASEEALRRNKFDGSYGKVDIKA